MADPTVRELILTQLSTISKKVDDISKTSHENAVSIAGLSARMDSVGTGLQSLQGTVETIKTRMDSLTLSEAKLTAKVAMLASGAAIVVVAVFEMFVRKVFS